MASRPRGVIIYAAQGNVYECLSIDVWTTCDSTASPRYLQLRLQVKLVGNLRVTLLP
jgi:hypothetical protein